MDNLGSWTYAPLIDGRPLQLDMWLAGSAANGRARVGYTLQFDGELIFSGDEYCPSPLLDPGSDCAAGDLLGFLSLKPGDTDAEYFESYTPRQIEFANEYGELIAVWSELLETGQPVA